MADVNYDDSVMQVRSPTLLDCCCLAAAIGCLWMTGGCSTAVVSLALSCPCGSPLSLVSVFFLACVSVWIYFTLRRCLCFSAKHCVPRLFCTAARSPPSPRPAPPL